MFYLAAIYMLGNLNKWSTAYSTCWFNMSCPYQVHLNDHIMVFIQLCTQGVQRSFRHELLFQECHC